MVDFLIVGPITVMGYKDIFPLFQKRKMLVGSFCINPYRRIYMKFDGNEKLVTSLWFQNLKEFPVPYMPTIPYNSDDYSTFDDFPHIINVDKISEIPDYDGVMGVPLGFLIKWNTEQFDVVGKICPVMDGQYKYYRILIKKK